MIVEEVQMDIFLLIFLWVMYFLQQLHVMYVPQGGRKMKTISEVSSDVFDNTIVHEAINNDIAENKDTQFEKREEEDEDVEIENGSESSSSLILYPVEAIRRKRVRKGHVQYLIKWLDWPESANTWEPLENLESISSLIEDFEQSSGKGKQRKRKHSQIVASSSRHVPSTSDSHHDLNQDSYSGDVGEPLNAEKRHDSCEITCMERAEVRTLDQNMQMLVSAAELIGSGKESEAEPQLQHDRQVQGLDREEEEHVTQPENVQHIVHENVQPHMDSSHVEFILQSLTQMHQYLDVKLKEIIDYIHDHFPPPH